MGVSANVSGDGQVGVPRLVCFPCMKRMRHYAILGALVLSACSPKSASPVSTQASQYLYCGPRQTTRHSRISLPCSTSLTTVRATGVW